MSKLISTRHTFCNWLHGLSISHANDLSIEIWSRYCTVYLERKPMKARGWAVEAHMKKEFGELMKPADEAQPVDFFNDFFDARSPIDGGTNSLNTIEHRHICFQRKPWKKLNTYQVLRFIKEGK